MPVGIDHHRSYKNEEEEENVRLKLYSKQKKLKREKDECLAELCESVIYSCNSQHCSTTLQNTSIFSGKKMKKKI